MKTRRPPRSIVVSWLLAAGLIIAGLLVSYYSGARTVGLALLILGAIGFLGGGIIIFIFVPRRE
jgi:hypothetical protein